MNLPTRTEKAVLSRLHNGLYNAALQLFESEFVNKDIESAYNWVGEFMDSKAPTEVVSKLITLYPELVVQNDGDNNCSLYHASRCHRLDVAKMITERGVSINKDLNGFGNCLNVAARFDNKSVMKGFLVLGAEPNFKSERGDAPIDIARRWGNYENVEFFETLEANPSYVAKIRENTTHLENEFVT